MDYRVIYPVCNLLSHSFFFPAKELPRALLSRHRISGHSITPARAKSEVEKGNKMYKSKEEGNKDRGDRRENSRAVGRHDYCDVEPQNGE